MKTGVRLRELDALRGVAAVAVLLFHLSCKGGWTVRIPWGHYGVELFFVISGFVILMTMERCQNVPEFLVSRLTRLYPAYWCAVLFTAAVVAMLAPDPASLRQIAVNLTMLQQFVYVPTLDPSYWTLALELVFYALIASWWHWHRSRPIELYCLAWIALVSLVRVVLFVRHEQVVGFVARPLLLYYGQLFIAGICIYRLRTATHRLTVPTLVAAISMSLFGGGPDSLSPAPLEYFFVSCLVTWLVWAGSGSQLAVLRSPLLIGLGEISYPLYLIHQRAGLTLQAFWQKYMPQYLAVLLVLLVLIGTATLIHRLIEVPARTLLRAWLRNALRTREVAPAAT